MGCHCRQACIGPRMGVWDRKGGGGRFPPGRDGCPDPGVQGQWRTQRWQSQVSSFPPPPTLCHYGLFRPTQKAVTGHPGLLVLAGEAWKPWALIRWVNFKGAGAGGGRAADSRANAASGPHLPPLLAQSPSQCASRTGSNCALIWTCGFVRPCWACGNRGKGSGQ